MTKACVPRFQILRILHLGRGRQSVSRAIRMCFAQAREQVINRFAIGDKSCPINYKNRKP